MITRKKIGDNNVIVHFYETPMAHRHGLYGAHRCSNTVWSIGVVDIHTRNVFKKVIIQGLVQICFFFR